MGEFLLGCAVDCDALDSLGNSPLHFAARAGAVELCRLLLSFGASASVRNSLGLTPLENARMMRPQTEELAEVEQLLSREEEEEEGGHASGHPHHHKNAINRSPSLQSADNIAPNPTGVRLRHRASQQPVTNSSGTTAAGYEESMRPPHRPHTRDEVLSQASQLRDDALQLKEKRLLRASNKASVEMVASAVKEREGLQSSILQSADYATPTSVNERNPPMDGTADDERSLSQDGDGSTSRQSNDDDDDGDDADGDDDDDRAASLTAADAFASYVWILAASLIDAALSLFLVPAAPLQRAEAHGAAIQGSSVKKSRPIALQWLQASLWVQLRSWSTVFRSSDKGTFGDETGEASSSSRVLLTSAPPTDRELSIRGLGNVNPSPSTATAAAAASPSSCLLLADQQLTPPDEVQVAVAMSRSATGGRSKDAPLPLDLLHQPLDLLHQQSGPDLHHHARSDGLVDGAVDPLLRPPTQPNVYSIGNALPRGAAWRYVDVLKNSQ